MIYGVSAINLIIWIIFAFIIGYLMDLIDPGEALGGVVGTIIFSIIGGVLGGYVFRLMFAASITVFTVEALLVSVAGAIILTFLYRIIFRSREHIKTTPTNIK